MKIVLLILTLFSLLLAAETFQATPRKDNVALRDSSGMLLRYLNKSDVVIVLSRDSKYYWVQDDVGDYGAVLKRDLKPVKGNVYFFDDDARDAEYNNNFFIRSLIDSTPMMDSFGVVQKYYDTDDRLLVKDSDSFSYWIKDDDGDRGFVRIDAVKKCEGRSYDFGETIQYEHPMPFNPDSLYPDVSTEQVLDPEIEELMRQLEELSETIK